MTKRISIGVIVMMTLLLAACAPNPEAAPSDRWTLGEALGASIGVVAIPAFLLWIACGVAFLTDHNELGRRIIWWAVGVTILGLALWVCTIWVAYLGY